MIQIVTGKLGAGKTLYTVGLMFKALCKGRTVVTNIAVNWDEICVLALKTKRVVLQPCQLIRIDPGQNKNWHEGIPFGSRTAFVEVFLDEIHLFFNARDWARTNAENKGLLSFLTQSRKAAINVTFIAQEATTMEKQFRVLAEWEVYITSSAHIPLGSLGMLPFKFFIASQRDAMNGNLIKKSYESYSRDLFKLYGSFAFLDREMQDLAENALFVDNCTLKKISLIRWSFYRLGFKRFAPSTSPSE